MNFDRWILRRIGIPMTPRTSNGGGGGPTRMPRRRLSRSCALGPLVVPEQVLIALDGQVGTLTPLVPRAVVIGEIGEPRAIQAKEDLRRRHTAVAIGRDRLLRVNASGDRRLANRLAGFPAPVRLDQGLRRQVDRARDMAAPAAAPPAPEVILAPPIQRRLQQIMDPLQLTQQQQRAVVEAVALKVTAYRDMAAARRALGASGKTPAEAAAAVEAFQAAASAYQAACRDADAALERRLVLSSLPVLKARLLATGVLGLQFAPPLSPGLGDSPSAPHPPGE